MKKNPIVFLVFFSLSATCMQQPELAQHVGLVPINIYFNNNNDGSVHADQNAQANSNAQAVNKVVQTNIQEMLSYVQQLQLSINKTTIQQAWNTSKGLLQEYKGEIIGGICVATYLGICLRIAADNHFTRRTNTWASWQHTTTQKELENMPQKKLGDSLIRDIQCKHVNKQNPTDFLLPLTRFLHEVQVEKQRLDHYLCITKWLSRFRLRLFFPTNEQHIKRAQTRLARLLLVQQIFLTWTANYNINNAMHLIPNT